MYQKKIPEESLEGETSGSMHSTESEVLSAPSGLYKYFKI